VNGNTIKIYDKAYAAEGNILRVETTVNNVEDFRTYRKAEGDEEGKEKWLPMRKGIADLHRRAEVSEAANERYWNALASIDDSATVEELVRRLEQPVKWKGGRVRGLRLFQATDATLLAAISRGGSAEAIGTSQSANPNDKSAWLAEEGTAHASLSGDRSRAKSANRHRHSTAGNRGGIV
jgi:hypothetical protein